MGGECRLGGACGDEAGTVRKTEVVKDLVEYDTTSFLKKLY